MKKVNIESIVIVKNRYGFVATLRFDDPSKDKFISSNKHRSIYDAIDEYVSELNAQ